MARFFRIGFALLWAAVALLVFVSYIERVPGLCDAAKDARFCRLTNATYCLFYSLYLLLGLSLSWAVLSRGSLWRWLLFIVLSMLSTAGALSYVLTHIQDVRTYSYEGFILSFWTWMILLWFCFLAGAMGLSKSRLALRLSVFFTVLFLIVGTLWGRGSIWHTGFLLGGFYPGYVWELIHTGLLVQFLLSIAATAAIILVVETVVYWIKDGDFHLQPLKRALFLVAAHALLIASTLITIPAGAALHRQDVAAAERYLDSLEPMLNEYKKQKGEFPKDISDMLPADREIPRLLKLHDYVLFDGKGGFYLSRPDQYCLVFHDPAPRQGYYSKTNDRDWRYTHEGQAFAEKYAAICDAEAPAEAAVAGHLGLEGIEDPLAQLHWELGESVRPSVSSAESGKLKLMLDELKKQNPELFKGQKEQGGSGGGMEQQQPAFLDWMKRIRKQPYDPDSEVARELTPEEEEARERERIESEQRLKGMIEKINP